MRLPSKFSYLPASLLLSWATPTLGQTITETETFGVGSPDYNTLLTFDSYSGPLAHLVSIEVTWSMTVEDGFLILDNDGAGPASGSYEFGAELEIDLANTEVTLTDSSFAPIFADTKVANTDTFNLGGNSGDGAGDFDPTGPDGIGVNGQVLSDSGGGFVNPLWHGQYIGTAGSTFDISLNTNEVLSVVTSGAVENQLTPVNASGSVTVTYHLVPEPSTALLSSLGLLALFRRRSA